MTDHEHSSENPDPNRVDKDISSAAVKSQDENTSKDSSEDEPFTAGHHTPEIATNDGSIIETLDTALHGIPGWSEGENLSGSSRADYYEARSYGKSDSDEELEELRKRNENKPDAKK